MFRSVLVPIDFDGSAPAALGLAKQLVQNVGGAHTTLHLVHVVTFLLVPGEPMSHAATQVDEVQKALKQLAAEHLPGIRHQILTRTGDTARSIVEAAAAVEADLILMPTHGRRGLRHFFLGSVAERVVRDASCPVLTFKPGTADQAEKVVDQLMLKDPPTLRPSDTLAEAHQVMERTGARSVAVLDGDRLVGIITDRDLRSHLGHLDDARVSTAMAPGPISVGPKMALNEAAELLVRLKVGALPVIENGKLVGMVSTDEVIRALVDRSGAN